MKQLGKPVPPIERSESRGGPGALGAEVAHPSKPAPARRTRGGHLDPDNPLCA
jgi:hypothetical protein